MNEIFRFSQSVKEEATKLLDESDIVNILEKYGKVYFSGSYDLDLMYKKDIDIGIVNDSLTVSEFTKLGKELIDKLNSPSVYYRNTRITPVKNRPENSLYWGIKTGDWFIDIWAMSKKVQSRSDAYIRDIKNKLKPAHKKIILQLKADLLEEKTYGKLFGSRELYDAVLNKKVKTVEEFKEYLKFVKQSNNYI